MPLARLIYISEPQFDPAAGSPLAQLGSILSASRRNNEAAGITGALAYDEQWFLQALEGERRAVWQTFNRICEDERHGGCLLIEMVDAEQRMFGDWWMGLATRDANTAPVFEPYLDRGVLRADAMRARDILSLLASLAKLGLHRKTRQAA